MGDELWRWQHAPAAAPDLSLEEAGFASIEGWESDDLRAALICFREAIESAPEFKALAAKIPAQAFSDRAAARSFFEANFTPYKVNAAPGLLTSYFEPALKGARQSSGNCRVPVYRRPPDLEPLPQGHPLALAGLTAGRKAEGGLVPYFTRAEIEEGALSGRGLELLHLSDPVLAYIMHVQGSGLVELADGGAIRIGFDGKNGHPYSSIGKVLVARGELSAEEATLDGLTAWLRAFPGKAQALFNENKSYIFFKEIGGDAPRGSLGAPLFAGRSLAVDPRYHPLGLPIWVSAPSLEFDGQPLSRLLIAKDTGSAIIGPQRGDLFAGTGDEAGAIAGRIRHLCTFIVLRPKDPFAV